MPIVSKDRIKKINPLIKLQKKNKNKSRTIIILNWKMNKKWNDIEAYFKNFRRLVRRNKILRNNIKHEWKIFLAVNDISVFPTQALAPKYFRIVSQNANENFDGAYTGQSSYSQLKEYGVKYFLVGHSETREYLGVTENDVANRTKVFLNNSLVPIVCIGESFNDHKKKKTIQVLVKQVTNIFKHINDGDKEVSFSKMMIAYEPIWCVGQNVIPPINELTNIFKKIRETVINLTSSDICSRIKFLYGGNVNFENIHHILSIPNVSGVLIGSVSLNSEETINIVKRTPRYLELKKSLNVIE